MLRRRLRTFTLGTGTLLCVLIVVLFVVSAWWRVGAQVGNDCVYLVAGRIQVGFRFILGNGPFVVEGHPFGLGSWNSWSFEPRWIKFPLWPLFLAVAVPTLLVWRFVPKFPRGHCRRCGYNLTGLTEARCPECGTGFLAAGRES